MKFSHKSKLLHKPVSFQSEQLYNVSLWAAEGN